MERLHHVWQVENKSCSKRMWFGNYNHALEQDYIKDPKDPIGYIVSIQDDELCSIFSRNGLIKRYFHEI
jgi:hypothetical protein